MTSPGASIIIPAHNEGSVIGRCLRVLLADAKPDEFDVIVVANCTPRPHQGYRLGAPQPGTWHLIANSDEDRWGGSGYYVPQRHDTSPEASGRWQHSLLLTLPPLAITMFAVRPEGAGE